MTAREYFENARAAQRRIDGCLARVEAMRSREGVRAQRYDAIGKSYGGDHDVMRITDARIDAESRIASEIAELRAIVEDARAVCSGIRAANPCSRWGDVLELRYCEDEDWRRLSNSMCISERQAHADHDAALDWVELVGIAAAREGVGQAALF